MNDDEKHTFGRHWYQYITEKVNNPLVFFMSSVFDKLPEPTRENTRWSNSHRLIEVRDGFFQHENNPKRFKALRAIFNYVIIKYDYDPYYHERLDWVIEKIITIVNAGEWVSHAYRLKNDQWWK